MQRKEISIQSLAIDFLEQRDNKKNHDQEKSMGRKDERKTRF